MPAWTLPIVFLVACVGLAQAPDEELRRLYESGERALAQHQYAAAEQSFEKLKQLSPGTAEVHGRLGLAYFQEGKFEQAVVALRQALKLKPDLPNTDILLAMSLSELGRYREALPGLEKGFNQKEDAALRRMSGLQLERAYTGLERNSKAVETALILNRLYPNDAEVLYQTSRIYANFAYVTLRKLAEVAPDSVWRHQAAAEAHESQGEYNLAIMEYRQVLKQTPSKPGIHFRVGRSLLRAAAQKNASPPAEARDEFEQELALDPTNANAAYELAEMYRKAGNMEKARQYFETALGYYPDFEEAQVGLGAVLVAAGKAAQALAHLQKATALDAGNPVSYYRLAQAYKALGNTTEQRNALARYRELRSKEAERTGLDKQLARHSDVTRQEVDRLLPD